MKINRQPLPELSGEIVQRDHDYWTKCVSPMIGDWLNYDTSVSQVAAFVEKVQLKQNFTGFKGDPQFIQNDYARRMFSKLRNSIAGVYAWRVEHAANESEKARWYAKLTSPSGRHTPCVPIRRKRCTVT